MDQAKTKELFDWLCRHRPLKEWLLDQLADQHEVLVASNDLDRLRQAQGQARFINSMVDKLDAAEKAAKAR